MLSRRVRSSSLARPGNLKAVVEIEGFQKMKNCLPVMIDLLS
jgi:hypothetical protein